MNWIPYTKQTKLKDDKNYFVCYLNLNNKKKYDSASFKDGKPFVVGNYFAFDMVKEILAYCEVTPYNP